MTNKQRAEKIRRKFTLGDWITVQRVGVVLLTASLVLGVIGYSNQHPEGFSIAQFLGDFYANVSTEFASIAITVLIIDTLNRRRESRVESQREREELIRTLGSKINERARQAAETLRARGWLTDGTLQEIDLRAANLEDADLFMADLQGANFQWAMLKNATLKKANLVGADFSNTRAWGARCYKADLRSANFTDAKLYRINFEKADLREAVFKGAILDGADMTGANLRGAHFTGAIFRGSNPNPDSHTLLPDGSAWTPDTDLARFTDPAHPAFWQPATDDAARDESGV
ncbi:MAG: pentapeptide repeat-containing protein [bacterium]|nr:pentapeptide repeat-containing protein [bacterium]